MNLKCTAHDDFSVCLLNTKSFIHGLINKYWTLTANLILTVDLRKLSQNSVLLSKGVLKCISVNPLRWLVPSSNAIFPKLSFKRVSYYTEFC